MRRPDRLSPLSPALIMVASVAAVVGIGLLIAGSASWTASETQIVVAINGFHNAFFDALARSINVIFGPTFALALTALAMAVAGLLRRSWFAAAQMGILIAVPWGAIDVVKMIVQRPRPEASLLTHTTVTEPASFSYPSGHTAFAAAIGVSVVMMLSGRRLRRVALVVAIVVASVTAWSRVYLGVHFPSDVLASLVLVPILVVGLSALTSRIRVFDPGPSAARFEGAASRPR